MIGNSQTKIDIILWDIDGTLIDFEAAEKAAIRTLFSEFGLGVCKDEMIRKYSKINKKYWEALERGEISKPEVLVGRFEEFFESEGIDISISADFNEKYQYSLGDTIVFCDNSKEVIESLRGKVKQYVVSNGTIKAQSKKLKVSGLGNLMDGIFLSEEIGVEKPNIEFFNKVFAEIKPKSKDSVLIVGDSLTSDIKGGNNAGIKTCWYNPASLPRTIDVKVDWEIRNIHEIFNILNL